MYRKLVTIIVTLLVLSAVAQAQNTKQTGVPVAPMEDTIYNCQSYIYYDIGKSDIKREYYRVLDSVVTYLKNNSSVRLRVFSYANEKKTDQLNIALSQKRAEQVMDYIVGKGIVMIYVIAKGLGNENKTAGDGNSSASGRRTAFRFEDRNYQGHSTIATEDVGREHNARLKRRRK